MDLARSHDKRRRARGSRLALRPHASLFLLNGLALAILSIGFTFPGRTYAGNLDQFLIYLWGVPDVANDEARAQALGEAGFTVVDWDPDKLAIAEQHGLRAMVHSSNTDAAKRLCSDHRVWGYHLGDEPYPEDTFPELARQFREIEQVAPHQVPFVNMLSTTGDFLAAYMETVRPPLLSYDYYQWWWGMDRYFEKLEQFREAASQAKVPLAVCVEATANPAVERGDKSYLSDNLNKLRQSVFTSLAYGVQGIEWFSAAIVFEPKSVRLTPAGRDVAALNRELKPLGPVLVGLRSVDVFQTAPIPSGTRTVPKEYWLHAVGEEGRPGLVQGMFKDTEGRDCVLLANRDYREAQVVSVRLQSKWLGIAPWDKPKAYKYEVEQFDRTTQQWGRLTSSSATGFTVVLGPADGQLFRISTRLSP